MGPSVLLVVQIAAHAACAALAVLPKKRLQFFEEIGFRTEMTEIGVALTLHLAHLFLHLLPVVTVEGVALHDRRGHAFAPEDLLESRPHGACPCAGRAGDDDDGVLNGHGTKPSKRCAIAVWTIAGFGSAGGSGAAFGGA